MKSCKNLKGGLQEVATELEVARIGPQHQAGSDSLLTGQTFFKMKEMFFEDDIDDTKVSPLYNRCFIGFLNVDILQYCGHLYGLGTNFIVPATGSGGTSTSGSAAGGNVPLTGSSSTSSIADNVASSASSVSSAGNNGISDGKTHRVLLFAEKTRISKMVFFDLLHFAEGGKSR